MRRLTCIALIVLGGCAAQAPATRIVSTAEPYCRSFTTICRGDADKLSEDTAKQIEANNLAHQALVKKGACRPRPEDACKASMPKLSKPPKPTS
jgi:hypothetical protein